MNRALKIKLLNGLEGCIPLDTTMLNEVDSAAEFIAIIEKFRTAIRKFKDRNPDLTWAVAFPLKTLTLNDTIHDIVNSRKYINFPDVSGNMRYYDQVFKLDFTTETITIYAMNAVTREHEELGSMHINSMFSNWKDLFYPDAVELPVEYLGSEDEEEEIEIIAEEETLYEYMRPKMEAHLSSSEMNLYDLLMTSPTRSEVDIPETAAFRINYSGSGDSGDIDSFQVIIDKEGEPRSVTDINHYYDKDTADSMYSAAWSTIDSRESGFVNNEGGYGEMNISATKFEWDHYNYITETDHSVSRQVDLEEKGIELVDELPSEIKEAFDAFMPETKSETTLEDIVKEHHPDLFDK